MRNLFEAVNIGSVQDTMEVVERSVLKLLGERDEFEILFEEISAKALLEDRLEDSALLLRQCEEFAKRCKAISETVINARKRVEETVSKLTDNLLDEMVAAGSEKVQTSNFKFSIRNNPDSIEVTSKSDVPKKYRRDPGPPPPWEKWEIDKNSVKAEWKLRTAVAESEDRKPQAIPGIEIVSSKRVEVKSR